jgi:hypothetical protein
MKTGGILTQDKNVLSAAKYTLGSTRTKTWIFFPFGALNLLLLTLPGKDGTAPFCGIGVGVVI